MTRRKGSVALSLLAAVVAVSTAAAGDRKQRLEVRSTLDHKRVLPQRIRWIAYSKPATSLARVDFLIDGKLRWIEDYAPFNYGGHDSHGHHGYLITTWLAPGKHRFTTHAVTTGGRNARRTVVARVVPAPPPPPQLRGPWTRKITAKDAEKADPKFRRGPFPGPTDLFFDRVGAWSYYPGGKGLVTQYAVRNGDVINAYAPIQMAPLIKHHTTISRFGAHDIGGFDCREDGPFGTYRWSVSGDTLTLAAIRERCGQRRVIWEGVWKRLR
jgi:hypothetical protein